jgi:hypothetical protein
MRKETKMVASWVDWKENAMDMILAVRKGSLSVGQSEGCLALPKEFQTVEILAAW